MTEREALETIQAMLVYKPAGRADVLEVVARLEMIVSEELGSVVPKEGSVKHLVEDTVEGQRPPKRTKH